MDEVDQLLVSHFSVLQLKKPLEFHAAMADWQTGGPMEVAMRWLTDMQGKIRQMTSPAWPPSCLPVCHRSMILQSHLQLQITKVRYKEPINLIHNIAIKNPYL